MAYKDEILDFGSHETTSEKDSTKMLYELIELAEKSSDSVALYKTKVIKGYLVITLLVVMNIFMAISLPDFAHDLSYSPAKDFLWLLLVFITILNLLYITYYIFQIKRLNKKRTVEKFVLRKLLNLLDGLKNLKYEKEDVSPVEKALIEMRLSRISFSD